jgi:hypothetical protein
MVSTGLPAPAALRVRVRRRGVSLVQTVPFYLVRCVGVLSVIGQNKLFCDWSAWIRLGVQQVPKKGRLSRRVGAQLGPKKSRW